MVSEEEVVWAYRYILGREPESETVTAGHCLARDWRALREVLIGSTEFQANAGIGLMPDRWVLADLGDRHMWVNLADRSVSFPCLQDDYEPFETRVVRLLLEPNSHFVDIGANIGWFSGIAATYLRNEGRIYSFEPRPETYRRLTATMALSGLGERATTWNVGLADKPGHMNLTWGEHTHNPGGSRLVHGAIPQGQEGVSVELRTLDSFNLPACDLIKIDIEGAEFMALDGAGATIEKYRPTILSEVHDAQLKSVSNCSAAAYVAATCDRGYRCFAVETGAPIAPDDLGCDAMLNVVFIPNDRVAETRRLLWPDAGT